MESLDKKAKSVKACETCNKPFGITRIRHTCKRCNKIICSDCTKARIKIVTYDLKAAHKVCLACEKEHNFQNNFKSSNQTSWNTLSKIAHKWLTLCNSLKGMARSQQSNEETYEGYLEIVKNPFFATQRDALNAINQDMAQGRFDRECTNYSLQEFLTHNQGNKPNKEQTRASVANVLKAFIVKFPEIGYCQGMNYICMFLLSLMDEESAFWILNFLVTKLLPPNFYGQMTAGAPPPGYQQEKFVLANLIKEHLNLDSNMTQKVTTLLDVNGPMLFTPLLVNHTNFEVLFETWDRMLVNRTINEIRKVIIHMVKMFLPKIKEKSIINPVEFQLMTVRLFGPEELKEAQAIKISSEQVKFLETKFRGDSSSQWAVNEARMHNALTKVTRFNKNQIRILREQFSKLLGTRPRRTSVKLGQSMMEEGEVIGKEDFKKLMNEALSTDPESNTWLKSLDVDQLYDSFDSDRNGTLDFREFLFLVSMMLKGSFEEKIQSAFYVFDNGDKGTLTSNEFEQFQQVLIQTTIRANQGHIVPFFNQDLERFSEKMGAISSTGKEKIDFNSIKKDLLSSDFIKYCEMIEKLGKQDETAQIKTHITHLKEEESKNDNTGEEILSEKDKENVLDSPVKEPSLKIEVAKDQVDSDNDNEENMMKLMQKWKEASPQKSKKTPANIQEGLEGTELLFDNNLTGLESLTSFDDPDHKPELNMDFEEDKRAALNGSIANLSKIASNPFAKNSLLPLSLTDVDIKPSDMSEVNLSFFGNSSDLTSDIHSSVSVLPKARKPFTADIYEALAIDIPPQQLQIGEWKEGCFESTQVFLSNPQPALVSLKIPKPFLENSVSIPVPEQEPYELPGLHFWRLDEIEQGDCPAKIADLVAPLKPIRKPISETGSFAPLLPQQDMADNMSKSFNLDSFSHIDTPMQIVVRPTMMRPLQKPFVESGLCSPLPPQDIVELPSLDISRGYLFENIDQAIPTSKVAAVQTSETLKMPFEMDCGLQPLPPSEPDEYLPTLSWKDNCFETTEAPPSGMEDFLDSRLTRNPFSNGICEPLPPQERSFDESDLLFGWKEDCFEPTENQPAQYSNSTAQIIDLIQKPFLEGGVEPLPKDERLFDAPVLEGWSNECFGPIERPLAQVKAEQPFKALGKPFAMGFYQTIPVQETEVNMPSLGGWKHNCFDTVEKSIAPVMSVQPIKPIQKPFSEGACSAIPKDEGILDRPVLGGWKEDCFNPLEEPATSTRNLAQLSKPIRRPFGDGTCNPLPQERDLEVPASEVWKVGCFESGDILLAPAELVQSFQPTKRPFAEEGACTPLQIQDLHLNSVGSLKEEEYFVRPNEPSKQMETAQLLKTLEKPFKEISLSPLSPREDLCDRPLPQGWSENCFISTEKPLENSQKAQPMRSAKNPFARGICEAIPSYQRQFDDVIGMWKKEMFESVDKPIVAGLPQAKSVPLTKPFAMSKELSPLPRDLEDPFVSKFDHKMFGTESQALLSQSLPLGNRPVSLDIQPNPMEDYEKIFWAYDTGSKADTVVLSSKTVSKVARQVYYEEKKVDESNHSETVVVSAQDIKSDDFEIVKASLESGNSEGTEEIIKTSPEGTSGSGQKIIVYDEEEEEEMDLKNSTFINTSAINRASSQSSSPTIYTKIKESASDSQLAEKRKMDASKEAVAPGQKSDSCKTCGLF